MRRTLVSLISLLIGIILLAWVIKVIGWITIKESFSHFSGWDGLIILFLTFLITLSVSLRWREILKNQGYKFPVRVLFAPSLAAHSIDYLMPTIPFGGELFRGYVLKDKHDVPWKIAISSSVIDQILEITSHLIFVFLGVIYFLFKLGLPPLSFIIFLGGGFLIAAFLLFILYFQSHRRESLLKFFLKKNSQFLEVEDEIMNFLNFRKKSFWRALAFSFLRDGVSLCRSFVLIFFLGKSLNLFSAFSVFSFSTLVHLFPIPTALGSHEIVQTVVFGRLGLSKNIALAFTMILRGADLIFAFFGIFLFFSFGIKLSNNFMPKGNNSNHGPINTTRR